MCDDNDSTGKLTHKGLCYVLLCLIIEPDYRARRSVMVVSGICGVGLLRLGELHGL